MKSVAYTVLSLTAVTGTLAAMDPGPAGNTATTITYIPTGLPVTPTQTGCPTITATRKLCMSCPVPACLGLSTVTQSCGCPTAIPTVYLDFPCSEGCKGIFCSTSYDVVTATDKCVSSLPTLSVTVPTEVPTRSSNSTATTATTSTRSTSRVVEANAAGRMEVPWAGWFV